MQSRRVLPARWLHPPVAIAAAVVFLLTANAWVAVPPAYAQSEPSGSKEEDWSKIVAAAKREGKVVVYTITNPPVNERLRADFRAAHPDISLEIVRLTGTDGVTKAEAEQSSGSDGADIVLTVEQLWLAEEAKKGAFAVPAGPAAGTWPAHYLAGGAAPTLSLEPMVIAYNAKLVSKPIAGYQDLLDPDFKGKIATIDPNITTVMVAWHDWLEKTMGREFLPNFGNQNLHIFASSVQSTQAVAAGEYSVVALTTMTTVDALINQGAPLKAVIPNPAYSISYGGAILGWAKRPNAAQVFMDYLMSVGGQTAWNGRGESASPRHGIPGSLNADGLSAWDPASYPPSVVNALKEKWTRELHAGARGNN